MKYSLREIDIASQSNWNASLKKSCLFLEVGWLKAMGPALQCFGIFDDKGKQWAGFAYFNGKLKGFDVLRTAPFTPHIGWAILPHGSNQAEQLSHEKRLTELLAEHLEAMAKKQIVILNLPPSWKDVQPFVWKGFKTQVKQTYVLSLEMHDFRENYAKKLQQALKKAEVDTLQSTVDPVDSTTMDLARKRLKETLGKDELAFLNQILQDFCNRQNSFTVKVSRGKGTECFAWIVHDEHRAFYIAGGKVSDTPHNSSGYLAIDKAIEECQRRGLDLFDFEGSMIPGVEQFFRAFGGDLQNYFQVNKASFWKEVLLKVKRRSSF